MIARDTMYITMYITLFREFLQRNHRKKWARIPTTYVGRMHLAYLPLVYTYTRRRVTSDERANSRKQRVGTCTKYKGGPGARINFHFASFDNFISPSGFSPPPLPSRAVSGNDSWRNIFSYETKLLCF